MSALHQGVKRVVDFFGAAMGLIFLFPVFLVISLFIMLSSPGPAFFSQERLGLGGKPFRMVKFRSMRIDAERLLRSNSELWNVYVKNGFKLPDGQDPRITPIGRWLRKNSLDELPQLWNVLCGHMSLVGPRPLLQDEVVTWYGDQASVLLSVRPGMTGFWQINGRSDVNYPERAQLELHYVANKSLWVDAHILMETIGAVVSRKGAH